MGEKLTILAELAEDCRQDDSGREPRAVPYATLAPDGAVLCPLG
jgi:hypothetical protein